jgi:simple sugar transport system substrate-binding protein
MTFKRKAVAILTMFAMALTIFAAVPSGAGASTGKTKLPPTAPPKLRNGDITIALVRELGSGDFFEQWALGAKQMASMLNVHLLYYDAEGNDALMATQFQQAMARHPNAIIVDHGQAATMDGLVNKAVSEGIPVVVFDLTTTNPKVVQVQQNDVKLGNLIETYMVDALKHTGKVAYVYVPGYAPLDRRNQAWIAVKKANPKIDQVAQYGTVSNSTEQAVESETKAVLTANPGLKAILAPYDAFATGATLAVEADHLQRTIKVYGADTGTPDIQLMIESGSPWVASACTDPNNDGAVLVRTATLMALGTKEPQYINIPPTLLTQHYLQANHITNIASLVKKLPALNTLSISTASWMPKINFAS